MKNHKKPIEIEIYEALCPSDPIDKDDPRRGEIIREMKFILAQTDIEKAARHIEWWGAWDDPVRGSRGYVRRAWKLRDSIL